MKKLDLSMGETWRAIFKRTIWVSVVIFEIVMIILANWLSNIMVLWRWITEDQSAVVLVGGIILGTILNEGIHSLWACLSYMFEDIAESRASNSQILELLKKQNFSEEDETVITAPTVYSDDKGSKIRSVSQRITENESSKNVPSQWECPECGRMNPMTASFCKDCGHYK